VNFHPINPLAMPLARLSSLSRKIGPTKKLLKISKVFKLKKIPYPLPLNCLAIKELKMIYYKLY